MYTILQQTIKLHDRPAKCSPAKIWAPSIDAGLKYQTTLWVVELKLLARVGAVLAVLIARYFPAM